MTNRDIITIFNEMWEGYPKIEKLSDIKYIDRGRERILGANIDSPERKEWVEKLPQTVQKAREMYGSKGWIDELSLVSRYSKPDYFNF